MTGFDWRLLGACTVKQAEDFFPLAFGADHVKAAKQRCAVCPVATRCLEWAVEQHETEGVWGGWTYAERRRRDVGPVRPPRPAVKAEPKAEPKPKPELKPAVVPTCAKPGHKPSDMRLRKARGRGYYCQACNADRLRALRARRRLTSELVLA